MEQKISLENYLLKIINNFSFSKSKSKWEVVGKLVELYLKSGNDLHLEGLIKQLKAQGAHMPTADSISKVEENYRAEILELIKIIVNGPS